jgi:hypothetical protein
MGKSLPTGGETQRNGTMKTTRRTMIKDFWLGLWKKFLAHIRLLNQALT